MLNRAPLRLRIKQKFIGHRLKKTSITHLHNAFLSGGEIRALRLSVMYFNHIKLNLATTDYAYKMYFIMVRACTIFCDRWNSKKINSNQRHWIFFRATTVKFCKCLPALLFAHTKHNKCYLFSNKRYYVSKMLESILLLCYICFDPEFKLFATRHNI